MNDENRREGESELDHRHRLKNARDSEDTKRLIERIEQYQPGTEKVARELAQQAQAVLADIIGPATISVKQTDTGETNMIGQGATAWVTVSARSKLGNERVELLFTVRAVMQGSALPDEITYSLDGTVDSSGGRQRGSRINLPIKQSGRQRPTIDDTLGDEIRKLVNLQ